VSSQVSICNQALLLLGTQKIQSLTEDTKEADIANTFYLDARNHVLRDIKPSFAIRRAAPPAPGATIDVNLPLTYLLPIDYNVMLSTLAGQDPSVPWVVEGNQLLAFTGMTQFVYVSNDPALETIFDSSFVKALAAYLASEFAYPLTGSAPKSEEMLKLYTIRKMACLEVYGMESAVRVTYNTQLTENR
jgi:hypothetical protein